MKFKYKLTRSLYLTILVISVTVVALACLALNVVRLVNLIRSNGVGTSGYDYASVILCIVLPVVCLAFIVALLCNSYYKIADGELTTRLGFLKDEYKISETAQIINNVKTKVLTVVFKDESPLRIVIDESEFLNFSHELMAANKNIVYGETDEDDKKKK